MSIKKNIKKWLIFKIIGGTIIRNKLTNINEGSECNTLISQQR